MNRFGTEANYWQAKLSRTPENGNEIFMNGPIVSSIFPNTAMKQSIPFSLLLAANRETCEPKRMNETGEDIYCNKVMGAMAGTTTGCDRQTVFL